MGGKSGRSLRRGREKALCLQLSNCRISRVARRRGGMQRWAMLGVARMQRHVTVKSRRRCAQAKPLFSLSLSKLRLDDFYRLHGRSPPRSDGGGPW